MITQKTIERVLEVAAIEEVIGEFVQLKKAGSNYKGLSPFVDEKTPSFMVSPAKGIFKDFSSGKGGNVLSFLMEHEQMSYPEAIRWLAEKYNIEIEEDQTETSPEQLEAHSLRESLYIVNQFAEKTFHENLFTTEEGKSIGLSYLKERQFSDETIKKFMLGYCLDQWEGFTKHALSSGYKIEFLQKTGLTKVTEEGKLFDFYKGRIMFPIHSVTGKVLGFGGRTLRADKKVAKYFNSPESDIYNKSRILYGLYQAKKSITQLDNCYLVEGYTDVISFHQAGIENVVASSGTALTKEQIALIKRYTPNITILYDGDAAGIKASFRGIDLILEQGLNVKALLFPEGDDPDSFAKKVSKSELETYLNQHAKDFVMFKAELLFAEAGDDPIKRAESINEIFQSITRFRDSTSKKNDYIRLFTDKFKLDEKSFRYQIEVFERNLSLKNNQISIPEKSEYVEKSKINIDELFSENQIEPQERDIIRLLLNYPDLLIKTTGEDEEGKDVEVEIPVAQYIVTELDNDDLQLQNPLYQKIIGIFRDYMTRDELPSVKSFYNSTDEELKNFAIDVTSTPYNLSHNWFTRHGIVPGTEDLKIDRAVNEALIMFKLKYVNVKIGLLEDKLKQAKEDEEMIELMTEIKYLRDAQNDFSNRLGIIVKK
jgi:DNA primase